MTHCEHFRGGVEAPPPLVCPRARFPALGNVSRERRGFSALEKHQVRTANIHIRYVPRTLPSTLQSEVAAPRQPMRQCVASEAVV